MHELLDIREIFPEIEFGNLLYVLNKNTNSVVDRLVDKGFRCFVIDGSKIIDHENFYQITARALNLNSLSISNFDAWIEYLEEFEESQTENRIAIIWEHADHTINNDLQIFLYGVIFMYEMAYRLRYPEFNFPDKDKYDPKEVWIFILREDTGSE